MEAARETQAGLREALERNLLLVTVLLAPTSIVVSIVMAVLPLLLKSGR